MTWLNNPISFVDAVAKACEKWAPDPGELLRFGVAFDENNRNIVVMVTRPDGTNPGTLVALQLLSHLNKVMYLGVGITTGCVSREEASCPSTSLALLLRAGVLYPDEVRANPAVTMYRMTDALLFSYLFKEPA